MLFIIVILLFIIVLLLVYIIMVKHDLKRISNEINSIYEADSNSVINSEISSRELTGLIKEINVLLKEKKRVVFEYNKKTDNLNKMMLNISHDLRTPLTSALGYVDILLSSKRDKRDYKNELKIIEERLKHLEYLINSFFEFSKVSLDNKNIELSSENIIEVLEESVVHYYDDFTKDKRAIILKKDVTRCNIITNRNMLVRIFDNLIANAYKHSVSDLVIDVKVKDKLVIKFSNDILYDDLDVSRIFDEFYTVDMSRTKGNTGLGLAIVKNFTTLLNGKIDARKLKKRLEITLKFDL